MHAELLDEMGDQGVPAADRLRCELPKPHAGYICKKEWEALSDDVGRCAKHFHMSHVSHEVDGRVSTTVVWLDSWELEVQRVSRVSDFPGEGATVDIIYVLLRGSAPSETSDDACKLDPISEESLP